VVVITKHTSEEGVLRGDGSGGPGLYPEAVTVKDLSEKIEPLLVEKLQAAEK